MHVQFQIVIFFVFYLIFEEISFKNFQPPLVHYSIYLFIYQMNPSQILFNVIMFVNAYVIRMSRHSSQRGFYHKIQSVFTILLLFHFNSIPKSQKVSWPNVNDFSITLRTTYILYLLYLLFVLFGIMYSSAVVFLCGGGGDTSHFIIAN